jgi:putative transposase
MTSEAFTGVPKGGGVRIGMDGVRRAYDHIFVERLWWSLKYEEVYVRDYGMVLDVRRGIGAWFEFYNHRPPRSRWRTAAREHAGSTGKTTGSTISRRNPSRIGSSADVISSNSISLGAIMSARINAARCLCPPDNRHTRECSLSSIPKREQRACARSAAASRCSSARS